MKDVNWFELESIIYFWGVKIGRVGGQIKEKYGTLRYYADVSSRVSLHDLIYPGYYHIMFPQKLYWIDEDYVRPVLTFFFGKLVQRYREFWYRFAYKRALKKFPNAREAILCSADHDYLLVGL